MSGGQRRYEGQLITSPLFSTPLRAETVRDHGDGTWVLGLVGTKSDGFHWVPLAYREAAVPRLQLCLGRLQRVRDPDGDWRLTKKGVDVLVARDPPAPPLRSSGFARTGKTWTIPWSVQSRMTGGRGG